MSDDQLTLGEEAQLTAILYTSAAFEKEGFEAQEITLAYSQHSIIYHSAAGRTCTTYACGEYWSCSVCGKCFSDESADTVIASPPYDYSKPPTGHNYKTPRYNWCDYYTKLKGTVPCQWCSDGWINEEIGVIQSTITSPGQNTSGNAIYISDRFVNSRLKQQTKEITIPALSQMPGFRFSK